MPAFDKRRIGRTSVEVSELGLGCATLGGSRIPVSRQEAEAIVAAAWAAGVSYVDTAPYYGFGLSERRVGDGVRGIDGAVVSTKVGRLLDPVPDVEGPRHGFVSPMPNWFNGGLGDFVWEQVSSPSFLEGGVWNGAAVRDFVAARRRTKAWTQEECKRVWRFVQAHLWRQAFLKKPAPPDLRKADPASRFRDGYETALWYLRAEAAAATPEGAVTRTAR